MLKHLQTNICPTNAAGVCAIPKLVFRWAVAQGRCSKYSGKLRTPGDGVSLGTGRRGHGQRAHRQRPAGSDFCRMRWLAPGKNKSGSTEPALTEYALAKRRSGTRPGPLFSPARTTMPSFLYTQGNGNTNRAGFVPANGPCTNISARGNLHQDISLQGIAELPTYNRAARESRGAGPVPRLLARGP